jgi:hypothetical protein
MSSVRKIALLQEKIAEERKKMNAAIVQGFPQQSLEDSIARLYRRLAEVQAQQRTT